MANYKNPNRDNMNIDYTYTKVCSACKSEMNAERYFYRNRALKDGYSNVCKECSKKHSKDYYSKNKERFKTLSRENYKNKYRDYLLLQKKAKEKAPKGCCFHHWNYNEQTVIILDRRSHSRIHKLLDADGSMFRVKETSELLDSFDKHYQFCLKYVMGMRDYHVIGFVDLSKC